MTTRRDAIRTLLALGGVCAAPAAIAVLASESETPTWESNKPAGFQRRVGTAYERWNPDYAAWDAELGAIARRVASIGTLGPPRT